LFTYAMMAHETGMPVWRHMMSHDPRNPDTWNKDMQAYVGEEFIVSPYYGDYPGNTGTVRKGIWLPTGTWYDYFEGTKYTGPTTIDYTVDPGTGSLNLKLPLFVKAGSIMPTMDTMQYVGEKPESTLTLGVWPVGTSQFTLYEDEKPTKTTFRCVNTASQTDVVIGPFAGSAYCADASKRRYAIELHGATAPQAVMSNGSALTKQASKAALDAAASGWFFDAAKGGITFVKSLGNASTGFTVSFCSSGQCSPVQSVRSLSPHEVAGTVRLISRRRIDVPYNGTYRVVVFDTNGAIIKTISGSGPSQVRLPASRGMSIVKVTTAKGATTLRVISTP
jgi:alpha-glucosidase